MTLAIQAKGQDNDARIDSLKNVVNTSKNDSLRLDALHEWDALIYWLDQDLDIELNIQMAEIASKNLHKDKSSGKYYSHMFATSRNNLGVAYIDRGEYDKAIESLTECLEIATAADDYKLMADAHNNIGNIYTEQLNFKVATSHYESSLALGLKSKNKQVEIAARGNLGFIFTAYADSAAKANNLQLETVYLDSAIIQYETTIDNCEKQMESDLSTYEQSAFPFYMITSLNGLAAIYIEKDEIEKAEELANEALEMGQEIDYKSAMSASLQTLAKIHLKRNEIQAAIDDAENAKAYALELKDAVNVRESSFVLYNCYKQKGRTKLALENYELFIANRDSINKEANQKASIEQVYKFEYQKKAVQDSIIALDKQKISDAQLGKKEAELKRQDQQIYGLAIFGILVLLMAVFMVIAMRQRKKGMKIIREQKLASDLQKAKIVESITYAKQIQSSLLPDLEEVLKLLPGFSVLYLPKDIVSGDFYWFHQNGNEAFVVLSDCTGHGVPGAFMSMIGSTLLKEIIVEAGNSNLSDILEKLDEGVRELLNQDENSMANDGMELAIIKVDLAKNELEFAAANQELWVVTDEVNVISSSMRSIGGWMRRRDRLPAFQSEKIDLNKVKSIFLTSDGFEDQFGGIKNEKFGRSQFRKLIEQSDKNSGLSYFHKAFDDWKSKEKQLDDVSVIRIDFNT